MNQVNSMFDHENFFKGFLSSEEYGQKILIINRLKKCNRLTLEIIKLINELNIASFTLHVPRERIGIYLSSYRIYTDKNFPDVRSLDGCFNQLRKELAPTNIIKNETGLIGGYLAMFFDVRGPVFTFLDSSLEHGILKAELDLKMNLVDVAIVIDSVFLTDPFFEEIHNYYNLKLENKIICGVIDKNSFEVVSKELMKWKEKV